MKKCIILANGKPPRKNIIKFFNQKGYNTLICADGGADSALKLRLAPDVIIGDMDSISAEAKRKFNKSSKLITIKRQNDTDVEKCLKYAMKNNFTEVLLTGVAGNRLDHTFCNLGIVLKFFSQIDISLIAEESYLKAYNGNVKLKSIKGETISLYGFDRKTKIQSKGLKYPLNDAALPFGEKESTSNLSKTSRVELKIRNGVIFIIRDVNVMMENDLF
ncbi:MAG: thiamine diphosphokinase [Ignavibacterium sp.]|nr:MAG: thiamine diphosphokinase [Ignavibacterium sp.]